MNTSEWQNASWYTAYLPAQLLTPALAIYPDAIRQNVRATLKLVDGDASRWRPHLKTVKAAFAVRIMVEEGVTQAKCATPLELETACACGLRDVVVAMSLVGPAVQRVLSIAAANPAVKISALVESQEHIAQWNGTGFPLLIDINPGMDRTGVAQDDAAAVVALARGIVAAGCTFAGLHYYDGHISDEDMDVRCTRAHDGYHRLMKLVVALQADGVVVPEVITSGTMTFPCALKFTEFQGGSFRHTISPGTVVYSDTASLSKLPETYGYRPAAVVLSRVMSRPIPGVITLDAGHKALSVDSGLPSGIILEMPDANPLKPSEEHLPVELASGTSAALGTLLHLVPKHVCTTVNNFTYTLVIADGTVTGVESVTARGRHAPLESASV
ncbi:MAG: alanine racemase [Janthinobacterium lividum]